MVKFNVTVDTREPDKLKKKLKTFPNIAVEEIELMVGDFQIEDSEGTVHIFERKQIGDLLSSVQDGRLWKQLQALKAVEQNGSRCYIILEGNRFAPFYHKKSKWSPSAILGLILSIPLKWKIPTIHSESVSDTAYILDRIAANLNATKRTHLIEPKIKATTESEVILRVVQALPGIGAVRSIMSMRVVKTLRKFFSLSEEDLVKLLGDKLGKDIFYLITAEFNDGTDKK